MIRTTTTWQRVSKARRCPICGKPDWCLFTGPADNPEAAICARVESPKRCGEAGWLHVLRDDGPVWPRWRRTIRRAVRTMQPEAPALDFARLAAEYQTALKPEALGWLADNLGLSAESLQRLGVGYSTGRRAWTFPMKHASGRTLGIRLRLPNGKKLSVCGSKEGLFIPLDLQPGGRLLIAEGPTDAAALLDLGFATVGRPSCSSGVKHLVELVKQLQPDEVVIVADGDPPGRRGAERLATTLAAYVRSVRVITPPDDVKDARAWLQAGGTAADVAAVINATEPQRLKVITQRKGRRTDGTARQER